MRVHVCVSRLDTEYLALMAPHTQGSRPGNKEAYALLPHQLLQGIRKSVRF